MKDIEEHVKTKLRARGFSEKTLMNNRGIIAAVIEDTADVINKNSISQHISDNEERVSVCPECGNPECHLTTDCFWCDECDTEFG